MRLFTRGTRRPCALPGRELPKWRLLPVAVSACSSPAWRVVWRSPCAGRPKAGPSFCARPCLWPNSQTSWQTTRGCWRGRPWARCACGRRGAGRELITRALDLARSRAAIGVLPYLLSHVAIDQATTNRWAEAEAGFHEVIDLARETHQMTDLAAALSRLAWLEGRQGQVQQSRAHATEAIQLAHELGLRLCEIWATAAVGELELGQGQSSEALAWFKRQESVVRECGIADVDLSPAPELVELYLRLGQPGPARQAASVFEGKPCRKGSRGRSPERRDAAVFWLTTSKWTESSPGRWSSTRRRPTCSRRPGRVWPTALGCAETGRGAFQGAVSDRHTAVRLPRGGAVVEDGPGRAGRNRGNRSRARPVDPRPAHPAGAPDRPPPGGRADNAGGGGIAVPQPQDRRVPPAQRLPEARHRVA